VFFLVLELSLVVPAYNEEKRIAPVLENLLSFFRKKRMSFEMIVVCNNCSDSTPKIVESLAKKNTEIVFLNFPFYTGKGGAVLKGFKAARKKIVGFADADESTAPSQFFKIYSAVVNGFDAAIGSRAISGSLVAKRQPFYRFIAAQFYRSLVELLFGLGIPDTQCGAKVFKKSAIDTVQPLMKSHGWEFDVELLWRIKQNGFAIKQVPIVWKDAKYSRFSFTATPKMFFALLKRRIGL